jgi:hypothetical protein
MIKFVNFQHTITNKELPHTAFIEKPNEKSHMDIIQKWCEENCQNQYSYCHFFIGSKTFSVTFHFKSLEDAVLFKLVNG